MPAIAVTITTAPIHANIHRAPCRTTRHCFLTPRLPTAALALVVAVLFEPNLVCLCHSGPELFTRMTSYLYCFGVWLAT